MQEEDSMRIAPHECGGRTYRVTLSPFHDGHCCQICGAVVDIVVNSDAVAFYEQPHGVKIRGLRVFSASRVRASQESTCNG